MPCKLKHVTVYCTHSMTKNSKNKSAAGMQHNPPRDVFNAKKIILKKNVYIQA